MNDVFAEAADQHMTRATDSAHAPSAAHADASAGTEGHVCPFCGLTREVTADFDPATPCPRCTLADTPATRNATKSRIGPWHVRQVRNPWAPGMGFETLLALVKRGQVTRDSIVRGPTTHQLWKRAAEVKGLSREFGVCFSCQAEIDTQANLCPFCNRLQEPPVHPDALLETREPSTSSKPPPVPAPRQAAPAVEDESQAPDIEIGGSTPKSSADDMLAADEAALAREITSRPPSAAALRPPRPLRPRTPGVDDALLTPQELAQAFQLGFSTPGGGKRRSKLLALLLIVLLIGGGAAALMSLRPDFRQSATRWLSEKYSAMKERFAPSGKPAAPALPPVAPPAAETAQAPNALREPEMIVPPAPVEPRGVEVADPPPTLVETPVAPAATQAVVPPVAEVPIPPPPPAEAPAPVIPEPPPAAADASRPELPQPGGPKPEAAPAEPAGTPEEQARALWRKAIDAEVNQDYVEAVSCYEKIKKLPADVQPWGLDVRLEQAKKLAK